MKITYRIHPLVEQQIEISELPEHLQERIYDFMNNINEISLSDMQDLKGTIEATIDEKGNINCLGCTNCRDCTECSYCKDCKDCDKCKNCICCISCSFCYKCTDCTNCKSCSYCIDCKR